MMLPIIFSNITFLAGFEVQEIDCKLFISLEKQSWKINKFVPFLLSSYSCL